MRKLPLPQISVIQIINDCVSNMREPNRSKYLSASEDISEYTAFYDLKMREKSGFELQPHSVITDELQGTDMIKLYDTKFAKRGQPGRKYYDRIKIAPENGICP